MSDHFKQFVGYCNREARRLEASDPRDQENLMNDLFALEDRFRAVIKEKGWEATVYNAFVDFINNEKKNVLSARVFFRERQTTFSREMSKIFKNPALYSTLNNYRLNFRLISWACKVFHQAKYKALHDIKAEVLKVRNTLAMKDVFLALNRARIFWAKTVNWKLEYMDIVQDACEGHMDAIDKFCPPYTHTYRNVIVGRMLLKMLIDNNSTTVKLPPTDSRVLYRLNTAKFREGLTVPEEILKFVQESFPNITLDRMLGIEASTEIHYPFGGSPDSSSESRWADDSEFGDPEKLTWEADFRGKFSSIYKDLSPFQLKLVTLKFGERD